jgi:hypothetical protein
MDYQNNEKKRIKTLQYQQKYNLHQILDTITWLLKVLKDVFHNFRKSF